MTLYIEYNDSAVYDDMIETVRNALGERGNIIAFSRGKVQMFGSAECNKEPEAFRPNEGDICTCVIENNIDAIFRYDGKARTDEDGNVWLDGDLGLTWSGDLFKPYMVIHGEDTEYLRDNCRLATKEEIALFECKVKEFEEPKG